MAVRSQRLAAGKYLGAAPGSIYVVPTGYRTILKAISVLNTHAGTNAAYFQLRLSGTEQAVIGLWMTAAGTVGEAANLDTFQVLHEGEAIYIDGVANGYWYWLSGAELLL